MQCQIVLDYWILTTFLAIWQMNVQLADLTNIASH